MCRARPARPPSPAGTPARLAAASPGGVSARTGPGRPPSPARAPRPPAGGASWPPRRAPMAAAISAAGAGPPASTSATESSAKPRTTWLAKEPVMSCIMRALLMPASGRALIGSVDWSGCWHGPALIPCCRRRGGCPPRVRPLRRCRSRAERAHTPASAGPVTIHLARYAPSASRCGERAAEADVEIGPDEHHLAPGDVAVGRRHLTAPVEFDVGRSRGLPPPSGR